MENKYIQKENFYSLNKSKIIEIIVGTVFIFLVLIIILYVSGFFTHIYYHGFQFGKN
jgi:hypothetical protein